MTARRRRIWTIGYEGHSPESLTLTLRDARIERLVDIRELPLSRKAGFSKSALAAGLAHAGIAYTHLRPLGTPRAVRHAYKADADHAVFRKAYLEHLDATPDAVPALEALADRQRCCVLCVERDWQECHRGFLAEVLAERGWTFTHL